MKINSVRDPAHLGPTFDKFSSVRYIPLTLLNITLRVFDRMSSTQSLILSKPRGEKKLTNERHLCKIFLLDSKMTRSFLRRCDRSEFRTVQSAVHNDSVERGDERCGFINARDIERIVAATATQQRGFRFRRFGYALGSQQGPEVKGFFVTSELTMVNFKKRFRS